jgi:probable Rubsico expression protein CbbX
MCKTIKNLILGQNQFIDIKACYQQTGIDSVLSSLDNELIGLKGVKERLREICSVLLFDRLRETQELSRLNSSLHMAFTGRSGTGKTTVALKIAQILRNLGYLSKGHLLNVTREDLVGQYVGHTAPKTREQLQKAHGGVLFIDEAHHLHKPDNERDYGTEAIELLLQVMENQREDLIIIFGGRKEKLEAFFHSNPGISSRIGNHIDFKDYELEDLLEITKFLLQTQFRYKCQKESEMPLKHYISQLLSSSAFANVRTIKIFLNQLFAYQAIRIEKNLLEKGSISYENFIKLQPEDFSSFVPEDFINIIGNENITIYKK